MSDQVSRKGLPGVLGVLLAALLAGAAAVSAQSLVFDKEWTSTADADGNHYVSAGDTLTYTLTATNDGTGTLEDVEITDSALSGLACTPAQPADLGPRATLWCTATYAVTADDVMAGRIDNTATVTAMSGMTEVTAEATETVAICPPSSTGDPFACTGRAFIVQSNPAILSRVVRTDEDSFVFQEIPLTWPLDWLTSDGDKLEINNLGFNKSDGFLYGYNRHLLTRGGAEGSAKERYVKIDSKGCVFRLDRGSLPAASYVAGDVSPSQIMYLNTNQDVDNTPSIDDTKQLYKVSLPARTPVSLQEISGGSGPVLDWAYNPGDGMLYGGNHRNPPTEMDTDDDAEVAKLNPANGMRTDTPVDGLPEGTTLPATGYGASWFDAAGRLFLYRNNGEIYQVRDPGGSPSIDNTLTGPASTLNDGTACVECSIGAAKAMMSSRGNRLPSTIVLEHVFQNFSPTEDLSQLNAVDDLSAVFGTHGSDWMFVEIRSDPSGFRNPDFDGHSDLELINQDPTQSLSRADGMSGGPDVATITVTLELLTHAGNVDSMYCNQVLTTGKLGDQAVRVGDVSTNGSDPAPGGNECPSDDEPTCFQVPVELMSFAIE